MEEKFDENENEIVEEVLDEVVDGDVEDNSTLEGDIVDETLLENQLEEAKAENQKLKKAVFDITDKYQKSIVEFDNFRNRTIKEKATMYDDGVLKTITTFLPVIDNLERALLSIDEDADDPLSKGVKMTLKQLNDIFNNLNVTQIEAKGKTFDPNLHSAMAQEDNPDFGENEIMEELLRGYMYKEKVIRPSMVKVAN